ncbi:MAG: hypothetical protein NC079_00620 [Clostridium sp.]|nr:hypothetical protein [Acetatifactor muris]MCM1527460.1 hypothetical protein [Bacteroides sp.]MCM1562094.1 hypothetical protein [Clostridium sp.]
MNTTMFLILLSLLSAISSLVTEAVKTLITDRVNLPYNLAAMITALVIGGGGTAVFYRLNAIPFTVNNMICLILMGLAAGLVSMTSYDKVRQAVEQIIGPKK